MQWNAFRRCLELIIFLQRGPQTSDNVLAKIYSDLDIQNPAKMFEKDRERVKEYLGVDLRYSHAQKAYTLHSLGDLTLVDLPEPAVDALVFLSTMFQPKTPHYYNIQSLLSTIVPLLPPERRRQLEQTASLGMDLRQRDQDVIPEFVWNKLETGYLERRVVEFEYRSPQQEDSIPRRHVVEIRKLYFDTNRRHYYLYGFCRYCVGPHGRADLDQYMRYRIGRIIPDSLHVLPQTFALIAQRPRMYEVKYWLSPSVARQGSSPLFEETQVDLQDDGSAIVSAVTDDLFHASRTLLYYGANCKVLGGVELLDEVRQLVQGLASLYEFRGED